jgi:hypothetical protein
MTLSADDTRVIGECLNADAHGPFFPDWEFSTLFGIERDACARIAAAWPDVDLADGDVQLAVNNSLVHFAGYPIDDEEQWSRYLSVSRDQIEAMFPRVRAALSAASE